MQAEEWFKVIRRTLEEGITILVYFACYYLAKLYEPVMDQNDPIGMKQLLEMFMLNNPAAFMNIASRDPNEIPPEMSMMLNAIAKQNKVTMEIEQPETRIPKPTEGQTNVLTNCVYAKFNFVLTV